MGLRACHARRIGRCTLSTRTRQDSAVVSNSLFYCIILCGLANSGVVPNGDCHVSREIGRLPYALTTGEARMNAISEMHRVTSSGAANGWARRIDGISTGETCVACADIFRASAPLMLNAPRCCMQSAPQSCSLSKLTRGV